MGVIIFAINTLDYYCYYYYHCVSKLKTHIPIAINTLHEKSNETSSEFAGYNLICKTSTISNK